MSLVRTHAYVSLCMARPAQPMHRHPGGRLAPCRLAPPALASGSIVAFASRRTSVSLNPRVFDSVFAERCPLERLRSCRVGVALVEDPRLTLARQLF